MKKYYLFAVILTVYTLLVILLGFNFGGSPLTLKKTKIDQQRLSTINTITYKINDYVAVNNKLPKSLEEIKLLDTELKVFKDSQLDFKVVSYNKYQLCTTFEVDLSKENMRRSLDYNYYSGEALRNHGIGYQCGDFTSTANTQINVRPSPVFNADLTSADPYTYKGDSDPKNDQVQSGTLDSKSFFSDNSTVIAFYLLDKLSNNDVNASIPFLLDENSKVISGNTTLTWADIRVGDTIQVTYGRASNGANYARIIEKL